MENAATILRRLAPDVPAISTIEFAKVLQRLEPSISCKNALQTALQLERALKGKGIDLRALADFITSDSNDASMQSIGHAQRGVSVHHLATVFMNAVEALGLDSTARISEVEPCVIRAKGQDMICPRDGIKGSSYVDAITGEDHAGLAAYMLSYTWGYSVGDLISSLCKFCEDRALNPRRTYIWICCLCINQHRVRELAALGETVPFEEFQAAFGDRVRGIGKVLALMTPWTSPLYMQRIWCIFELYTSIVEDTQLTVIMPPQEASRLCRGLADKSVKIDDVFKALSAVDIVKAEASVEEDRNRILKLVEETSGFQAVNVAVAQKLQSWFSTTLESELRPLLAEVRSSLELASVPVETSKLEWITDSIIEVAEFDLYLGHLDKASKLLEDCLVFLRGQGQEKSMIWVRVLRKVGVARQMSGQFTAALESFQDAIHIIESLNMSNCDVHAALLRNVGVVKRKLNDLPGALEAYGLSLQILKTSGQQDSRQGAGVLQEMGLVRRLLGHFESAREAHEAALSIYTATQSRQTPACAALLCDMGVLCKEQGDLEQALARFEASKSIFEMTTPSSPIFLMVLKHIADILADGNHAQGQSFKP